MDVVGITGIFDARVVELKLRAEGVPDRSGNMVQSTDADSNQKTASVR